MNKSDLIDAIANHANLTKADAVRALEGITHTIQAALKAGDSVALVRLN
jgi:DNA-binding protein HU-beta